LKISHLVPSNNKRGFSHPCRTPLLLCCRAFKTAWRIPAFCLLWIYF